MVFCKNCNEDVEAYVNDSGGFSSCTVCGAVLEDTAYASDVAFTKDAGGDSAVVGHFVSESGEARGIGRISGGKVYSTDQGDSHERSVHKGKLEIQALVDHLSIQHRDDTVDSSHRLYRLALQHNFTRGRRVNQVAAACIYLYCRQATPPKPFMLIDFSDLLLINVFDLGTVFVSLMLLLRLDQHPVLARPVDPSLYLHRFAARLNLGRKMHLVANTAMQLVKSMKRDWLQTGRRPAGICGAALYIACQVHGFDKTKHDVIRVVHIGEATLAKRVHEFTNTASGQLTADQFAEHVKQVEGEDSRELQATVPAGDVELLEAGQPCEHVENGTTHFAKGMCKTCYLQYMETSGGHQHGAHPPAYARALQLADEEWQQQADEEAEEGFPLGLPAPGDEYRDDTVENAMDAAMAAQELGGFRALMPQDALQNGLRQDSDGTVPLPPDPDEEPLRLLPPPSALQNGPWQASDGTVPQPPDSDEEPPRLLPPPSDADATEGGQDAVTGNEPHAQSTAEPAANASDEDAEDEEPEYDNFSDIDDAEIDGMILSEEESKSRAKVWEQMNADWLEKQAAREAAEAARLAIQAGEVQPDSAPKGKKRGRKPGQKNTGPELNDGKPPPESASEAAERMLAHKKLHSKLNLDVLEHLFDEKPRGQDGSEGRKSKKSKVGAAFAERQRRQAEEDAKRRKRDEEALAADEARRDQTSMPPPPAKLGSLRDGFRPSLRVGRSR